MLLYVCLCLSADPPRHTSILALPDLMEGYEGSFSLRCSSDANPKVENYTWFKVNVTPPVGWDQNYSTEESGWYYCMAWNKLGMQRSVSFHINGRSECFCVRIFTFVSPHCYNSLLIQFPFFFPVIFFLGLLSSLLMLILIIAGVLCLCTTVTVAVFCALKRYSLSL